MMLAIWLFMSPWVLQLGQHLSIAQPTPDIDAAAHAASSNAFVLGVIVFLVTLLPSVGWSCGRSG
jgi:hypothetical protein